MKKIILAIGLLITSFSLLADTYVRGHYRSNGSYVKGHYRSSPDNSKMNNWSTRGNTNPYTGQVGTRTPAPSYNNNIGTIRSNTKSFGSGSTRRGSNFGSFGK